MRSLGLDVGDRRIGVAASDAEEILASPLATVARDDDEKAVNAILDLARKYQVKRIVVGLPYSLDGSIGAQAGKVMAFVAKLSECAKIDVVTWDERSSTVTADRLLAEAGARKDVARARRDAAAAAVILQAYLDSRKASDQ